MKQLKPINQFCPNAGKPIENDSLTSYGGFVIGFCNLDCRDELSQNPNHPSKAKDCFDRLIEKMTLKK